MKKAVTAALLAMMMAASVQAADKMTTVPVHFAKGAHSAKVDGASLRLSTPSLHPGAPRGQTVTVAITGSTNANFNVFAPGAIRVRPALGGGDVDTKWQGTLPKSGKC